jgi:prepilin-type N-terminal cleavage/methylation domain-containing protein
MDVMIGTRGRASQRGFTLAELLVAIAVLGLITIGILVLLMTGNQSYLTGSNQAEAQAAARAALERMTLDIREGGYDPQGRGACTAPGVPANCFNAILNPSATGFIIQSDWNGSGLVEAGGPGQPVQVNYKTWNGAAFVDTPMPRGEQVTYSVVGGTLCRQESAIDLVAEAPCPAGVPLVTSIQQAVEGGVAQSFFEYLDGNGTIIANPAANPEGIRTVVVRVRVGVQNQPPAIWQAGAVQVTMSDRIRLRNR